MWSPLATWTQRSIIRPSLTFEGCLFSPVFSERVGKRLPWPDPRTLRPQLPLALCFGLAGCFNVEWLMLALKGLRCITAFLVHSCVCPLWPIRVASCSAHTHFILTHANVWIVIEEWRRRRFMRWNSVHRGTLRPMESTVYETFVSEYWVNIRVCFSERQELDGQRGLTAGMEFIYLISLWTLMSHYAIGTGWARWSPEVQGSPRSSDDWFF